MNDNAEVCCILRDLQHITNIRQRGIYITFSKRVGPGPEGTRVQKPSLPSWMVKELTKTHDSGLHHITEFKSYNQLL